MEILKMPKNAEFQCDFCDFTCFKKSNYDIHCQTIKHSLRLNGNKMENVEIKKNAAYECKCRKIYSNASGLWKHKKVCKFDKKINENDSIISHDDNNNKLIEYLMKENKEIKEMILEIVKNGITHTNNNNNNNNTTTNSHNKAFNLNFFLNETCKDAMNITDFVDSINLQLSDLEKVGELGYVEGISSIIIKNLNALDETKRPLHCTDKKRETIYIKNEGQWEKEDDNKTKLKRLITKVSNKNSRLLTQYREKYPECKKCDSKISDKFNKMVIEAMGGLGENNAEKEEKIIRNISKEVTISSRTNEK